MNTTFVKTFSLTIHMAGSISTAKAFLRNECYQRGLCVTVSPETFIYSGGEEEGFAIGLVNYPRFPSSPEEIRSRALSIAEQLLVTCCQKTALLVDTEQTTWLKKDPPGMTK